MEPSIHEQSNLSLPGQYPPLCQGIKACQQYLIFLNHPVLVVLGGRLPGDHNCRPVPIVLSYWNTLRWSTRSCLFGKKDWTVKVVTHRSELLRGRWFLGFTNTFFYAPPFTEGSSCPQDKMIQKENDVNLQPGSWFLLQSCCAGEEKVTLVSRLSKLRYPLPECHSPESLNSSLVSNHLTQEQEFWKIQSINWLQWNAKSHFL